MPDVAALLAELTRGTDDPDVVAEELRRRGVRGRPECPESCVIAEYLTMCGVHKPEVSDIDQMVTWDDCVDGVPMPDGIYAFVLQFDAYDYPDLEIGGDDA